MTIITTTVVAKKLDDVFAFSEDFLHKSDYILNSFFLIKIHMTWGLSNWRLVC